MREFLLASPLTPGFNTGAGPQISTIVASENGVVHLDRLLIGAAATNEQAGYTDWDLSQAAVVDGLLINGSTELIRGRNAPQPPISIFSPLRQKPIVGFGDWSFGTGDTVQLTATMGGAGVTGNLTTCAPFSPRNRRSGYTGPVPAVRQTFAGSPGVGVPAGGAANVVVTFDQDGVADLDSLVLMAGYNPNAAGSNDYADLGGAYVNQITLPSGDQLILGQGQFGVAASIFSALRSGNWWTPGLEWVSAGSTIVLNVSNVASQASTIAAGMPFYPGSKGDLCR